MGEGFPIGSDELEVYYFATFVLKLNIKIGRIGQNNAHFVRYLKNKNCVKFLNSFQNNNL